MNSIEAQGAHSGDSTAASQVPNGPVAAAILSAGIGCFVLGLLAVIGDGSAAAARALTFYFPTGPLSGVTTSAILVWLAAWFVLARRWRSRTVVMIKVNAIAFVLLGLSLLLTFPPFADLLLGK
jgi:hypothetical protein